MASMETPFQEVSQGVRKLSEQEVAKLEEDVNVVSEFKQNKLELEAKKNWDLFYKRNTTKFFKDRHWTKREFEELTNRCKRLAKKQVLFEVGCGVGNFMFPLLAEDDHIYFYACDFSPRAVDFVKSHTAYDMNRCTAFQCDITVDAITDKVPAETVDVATMIFVLSAIHPEKMIQSVKNVAQTLKPGGILLIRDYGLYDHAMLRFAKGHKLSECFYVRQDGTRAYYFSLEKLQSIMEEAGLTTKHSSYIQRSTVNVKERINVPRIFVQGKFSKPPVEVSSSEVQEKGHIDSHSELDNTMNLEELRMLQLQASESDNNVQKYSGCLQSTSHLTISNDFGQDVQDQKSIEKADSGNVNFESECVIAGSNLQKLPIKGDQEEKDGHAFQKFS